MSSNESIVGPDDSVRLNPKKRVTCTLTAQVKHPVTGAVRLSASLTVKVGSFVTGIDILHYNLACYVGDDLTATAYSTGYLPQPSSALTVRSGYETINVFVGQNDILNDKLLNAFVITPENTTDAVVETIEDETVVNYERGYNILKAGTTKVTKTVYDGIEYMDKGNQAAV